MTSARQRVLGFTMVELMITLTVVLVIAMIAVPSFISFRQRSALRAAAEQAQGFWNQARLESAKRNSLIKVGVFVSGNSYCLGAKTTTIGATDNDEPCDCTTTGAADSCDVARFPDDQKQWQGVTLVGTPTPGNNTGVTVIESRRTSLVDPTTEGSITFGAPEGPNDYALNLYIDRQGRATLCQSNNAGDKMSDYTSRNCDP